MSPVLAGALAALGPAVAAALVWIAGYRLGRGGVGLAALAAGSGVLVAQVVLTGVPAMPPTAAAGWRFLAVFVLIAVALPGPGPLRGAARLLVVAALTALQFKNPLEHTWSWAEGLAWVAVLPMAVLTTWERLEKRCEQGLPMLAGLAIWVGACAAAVGGSGSALLGQQLGALAAVATALAVLPSSRHGRAVRGVLAVVLPLGVALLTEGLHFARLEPAHYGLLLGALLPLGLLGRGRLGAVGALGGLVALVVPVLVDVAQAAQEAASAPPY